jgi:DNA-binding HxlR family transcriptional regulator
LRTGGQTLLLFSDPIKVSILRLLARRSLQTAELGERLQNVSRSTRFARLRELEGLGVIAREKRGGAPPVTHCRLTASGRELLSVGALLEVWLRQAPGQSIALGGASATLTIKALTLGWGSTLLRWLAERPRSLGEVEPLVSDVGYRELERILRNLIDVGLAERVPGGQRTRPYALTDWARESVAPLGAAMRWERRHIPERGAPLTAIDAEGGLLLALPLIELPMGIDGDCTLVVDTDAAGAERTGRVAAQIADGRIAPNALPNGSGPGHKWVRGTAWAWLDAVIEGRPTTLQASCGGDLAESLIDGLRLALLRRLTRAPGRVFDVS